MASVKTRSGFVDTDEGQEMKRELQRMMTDSAYNTKPSYSGNQLLYPDNQMPFVDKHMNYIMGHPMLEPSQYLANVKLLTRVR